MWNNHSISCTYILYLGEGGAEGGAEGEEEDTTVYEYKPPEAKIWQHLGSQNEIEDEVIVETREKVNACG